jgi:hypothetical protein
METEELEGLRKDKLPSIYCREESKTRTWILRLELKIGWDIITISLLIEEILLMDAN